MTSDETSSPESQTMPMQMPETVDAGPVTLQRWTVDRAGELDRAINESLPELASFMPWATADHSLENTTSFLVQSQLEWDDGEAFNYAILAPHRDIVGSCGLMSRRGPDVYEIGYWVHSDHAGKGYATAAAKALTQVGLARPGIERIEIYHDLENRASGRVAAKAGFGEAGRVAREKQALRDSGTDQVWVRRRADAT